MTMRIEETGVPAITGPIKICLFETLYSLYKSKLIYSVDNVFCNLCEKTQIWKFNIQFHFLHTVFQQDSGTLFYAKVNCGCQL